MANKKDWFEYKNPEVRAFTVLDSFYLSDNWTGKRVGTTKRKFDNIALAWLKYRGMIDDGK